MTWKLISISMNMLNDKKDTLNVQIMNNESNIFSTKIQLDKEKLLNTTLAEIQESAISEMKKSTC